MWDCCCCFHITSGQGLLSPVLYQSTQHLDLRVNPNNHIFTSPGAKHVQYLGCSLVERKHNFKMVNFKSSSLRYFKSNKRHLWLVESIQHQRIWQSEKENQLSYATSLMLLCITGFKIHVSRTIYLKDCPSRN